MLVLNLLNVKIVDVETAFLHGDLKEGTFMEISEGMDAAKEDFIVWSRVQVSSTID
jgi:hypothetical protein